MNLSTKKTFYQFAVAALAVAAAVVVTLLFPALGSGGMYFLFLTAIIFSSLRGDWRSGAFAAALSIAVNFFLLDYLGKSPHTFGDWVILIAFALAAGFTIFICHAQMKAESARRLAESRYRIIFEDAITGIYETTLDGRYAAANPKLAQIFGYQSPAELIQTAENLNEKFYVEPGRREEFASLVEKSGNISGFESEIYRRDGAQIWITENSVAVRDAQGTLVGFQGTTIEITDRKLAQAALQKAHEELEEKVIERTIDLERANEILRAEIVERQLAETALFESQMRLRSVVIAAPVILFALDRDGRYTLSEGKGLESLGLRAGEVIGKSVFELYAETPKIIAHVKRALAGESFTGTSEIGDLSYESRYTTTFDDKGEVTGLIGVSIDVTESRKIENELRASQKQLRDLSGHLQSVREEERKEIARELHDELGQSLTALKIELVRLGDRMQNGSGQKAFGANAENKIPAMLAIIDTAMETTRKIVAELRPGALDELGLAAALEWQVRQFQKRTGIICGLNIKFDEPAASQTLKTTVFRILQECLTNIARHSGASSVRITLCDEGDRIFFEVEDNGRGITEEQAAAHNARSFGILGMRERALLLGGAVEINPVERDGGTRVTVAIPRPA